jgi:hypothetical protein
MGVPAFATTLCTSGATIDGPGTTATSTTVSGTNCSTDTKISITTDTGYGKVTYMPGSPSNYPSNLTLGNLSSLSANVSFTSSQSSDQPYIELAFTDSSDSLGQASATDQILLLEFEPTTITGGNTLAANPGTTLFNLLDNTTNNYLEGGQADAQTLDYWLTTFSGLDSESIQQIRLAIGLAGGSCATCSESLTIDSLDIEEAAATPEPGTLCMVATGMLSLAGIVAMRRRNLFALEQAI